MSSIPSIDLDGRSKVEIAEEFGLSRFKVARFIDAARDGGLVHIEIRHHYIPKTPRLLC